MIEKKQFVYRLVDDRGNVLYVGQHTGIHPGARVAQHKDKPWWPEVSDWDFEEVTGNLNAAEHDLISFWGPYYNMENLGWRADYEARSTIDLIFQAGEAAASFHFEGLCLFAGRLKLIRTVLWRRDKTEVPPGYYFSETPRNFRQGWDFVDFPVLSPNGFIGPMGSFRPVSFLVGHPECAFERDCWPLTNSDDETEWNLWLENAMQEGRTVSYTGLHNQPAESRSDRPAA